MQLTYVTERLSLKKLALNDADFIFKLVNTAGWIKFIGDRNVKNKADAEQYIQKIMSNADVSYWIVTLQQTNTAIGVVTLIKRNYLDNSDIGFAFLPAYAKQGYAFEATLEVLTDLLKPAEHTTLLATTLPDNLSSIQLLKKLGFIFEKEITNDADTLQLFSITEDRLVLAK